MVIGEDLSAKFTNKIYPTEGIEIYVTNHFLQRWNSRLQNRSPEYLNWSIEHKKIRYMCRGMDNSFHFLYRDQYGKFFILIIGNNGGIETILPKELYMQQADAVNLSSHIEAFTKLDNEKVLKIENTPIQEKKR